MHPTPTQPSSMLRATMHTRKKRKNTSFRLQRELCGSFPLSLFKSLYLFFSVSPFSSPPRNPATVTTMRNPQAVHRQRSFFLLLPLLSLFLSYTSCPLFLFLFLFGSQFSQAACCRCQIFFLFFGILEICIFTMTASYMTPCSCSLLFPSKQTPKHILCPLCSHTSTTTYHNSHQHGA